ncbi:MAG: hypothetical protein ACLP9K_02190 [Nitrososphaerales archaeon]
MEDGEGSTVTKHIDDSAEAERLTAGVKVASIGELSEVVGKLVAVDRNGVAVIEATRRFEVSVEGKVARSMGAAIGRKVAILRIDGKTRWRLLRASPRRTGVSEMSE